MLMDNSAFLGTCMDFLDDMLDYHDLNQNGSGRDFAKILDLIEKFHPFGSFCNENKDFDTLFDNYPRCTDRNNT